MQKNSNAPVQPSLLIHSLTLMPVVPQKTIVIIVGPTAVGKTAVAIQLAQHFSTQIISADSRQCYQEPVIGVAKPSAAELALVPHHFINSHSLHDTVNAAVFETYALDKVSEIFSKQDVAIMVGGTGLYIKTFCEGIDEVPPIQPGLRESIISDYTLKGIVWLQQRVQQTDPLYYAVGEIQNPHRLMRALEIKLATGKSILEFQKQQKAVRDFNIIKIGLELPREILYQRINERVIKMVQEGLVAEAKLLEPFQHFNALQTVGYKEIFEHFAGLTTLQQAIINIQVNTRRYAKRQLTWFKKDPAIHWCNPGFEQVLLQIKTAGCDPAV